ncbi:hypothetical protein [Scytonema sp. PRP1]|uniref:hypothetical protein n=1 Tax=Scytonema sp. PRP1 TaxID=3120513 RepID=UPI00300C4BD8
MWVRLIFWLTLLLWIADIAQPGYLQFYNWREAAALLQKVQKTALSTQVGGESEQALRDLSKRKKTQLHRQDFSQNEATVSVSTSTPSSSSNCRVAKNDFESVLQDSQVGCWLAVPANARNKN